MDIVPPVGSEKSPKMIENFVNTLENQVEKSNILSKADTNSFQNVSRKPNHFHKQKAILKNLFPSWPVGGGDAGKWKSFSRAIHNGFYMVLLLLYNTPIWMQTVTVTISI